jgi:hypothetical protein
MRRRGALTRRRGGPNDGPTAPERYNRGLEKAGVAQSVEQLIRNEKVGCSIHLSGKLSR